MRELSLLQALQEGIAQEMERDEDVFLIGEDIRIGGGFGVTRGFFDRFGGERVRDTPISETGFIGAAIGAAVMGMRPVAEFQFGDFVFCAMDQVVNEAAKLYYMSGGQTAVPLTLRLPIGANRRSAQHSQCSESIFMAVPGLKLAAPSTPYDAKGLMISAIRDNNPVLFFEHKLLYQKKSLTGTAPERDGGGVPEEPYEIPFGQAVVRREGEHATVVATHLMLRRALEAASGLSEEGVQIEVVDPRTLVPFDISSVVSSVRKTGRLVVVHESPLTGGWAADVIAGVCETLGGACVVKRIASYDTPVPYAPVLEDEVIPSVQRIKEGIRSVLEG